MIDLNALNFDKAGGSVAVVTQHAVTGAVLMIAHADREALERTIESGEMHYRSRTRGLWHKGATSGNTQRVVSLSADCDGDAVLARVVPNGPACHVGMTSCFGETALSADAFGMLDAVIAQRARDLDGVGDKSTGEPTGSYTQRLLADRNLRLKKIGEESAELVLACADGDKGKAVEEAADLFYHVLVALRRTGATLDDLRSQLATRSSAFRPSSIP
jgi:phosphoribosyl-ATP pyrophosphohydrolase/phosphoribosyl-AMP cyclohydrolase